MSGADPTAAGDVDAPPRNTLADGLRGIGRREPRADGDERSDEAADRHDRRVLRASLQRPLILAVLMGAAAVVVAIVVTRGHA
ncbi:hypothetical protein [Agrococcus jejuensis]|uniref:Uncharacterized protein n=1 Tax=Agrococcus jejuensis TaxID=399736 RepID=A0A1G8DNQ1_9MICO|nr:hypothetical protein [Agrococcus jejuensis]SDH59287.1 hypothetical protein SAMN04489720_1715 [Agrococcus jejuensis]